MSVFSELPPYGQSLLMIELFLVMITQIGLLTGEWSAERRRRIGPDLLLFSGELVLLVSLKRLREGCCPLQGLDLPVLFLVLLQSALWIYALVSFYRIWKSERERITPRSIKESFDNLPVGICFFDENGRVCLINRQMLAIGEKVLNDGIQYADQFYDILRQPPEQAVRINGSLPVFRFPNGQVFQFERQDFISQAGKPITEVTATDVTELEQRYQELRQEAEILADANRRARQLYDQMTEIVRDEEILAMKMRVHDDIGYSILAARHSLLHDESVAAIRQNARVWNDAIALLNHSNRLSEPLNLSEDFRHRARELGVEAYFFGPLPESPGQQYLIGRILRECLTNSVRHANASAIYANARKERAGYSLTVTDNGQPPQLPIVEGGGLSALRHCLQKSGGRMEILSRPHFTLQVFLPKEERKDD